MLNGTQGRKYAEVAKDRKIQKDSHHTPGDATEGWRNTKVRRDAGNFKASGSCFCQTEKDKYHIDLTYMRNKKKKTKKPNSRIQRTDSGLPGVEAGE